MGMDIECSAVDGRRCNRRCWPCISCLVFFVVFFGLIIWGFIHGLQSMSCISPRVYIHELYAPALTSSSSKNTSILIDLQFWRSRSAVPIFRESVLNVYYGVDEPSFPVANHTVPAILQLTHQRRVDYRAVVEAPRLQTLSAGSTVALLLELRAQYQDTNCDCCHLVPLNCRAEVWLNASGHNLSNKPIEFH